jgi:acetolactate synthase regulatory subunit
MWLPPELAMLVGLYLDPHDLQMCTTQLCSSGAGFVANLFANDATTICLHDLVACCRLSVGVDDIADECIERIAAFVKRRGNVQSIAVKAHLMGMYATNASVYLKFHRRLQQGSSFHLSQNQTINVKWNVGAEFLAQVEFLLKVDVPTAGAHVSDSSASGALRQYLHTLDLYPSQVSDLSVLASCRSLHTLILSYNSQLSDVSAFSSCESLHTLDLSNTQVSDVSALASCQSLYTLNLWNTKVSDVSPLALCQSLHTLNLKATQVSDVSAFSSCESLHTLDLSNTKVSDVSALASCQSLYTLHLKFTKVSDVSALAACQSLHTLNLKYTKVSDVSALASCQSLSELWGVDGMIGGTAVLRLIQDRD